MIKRNWRTASNASPPYAGATVRLRFNTVRGQALLITAQRPDNAPILMGANVLDNAGNSVGMVGQANQVYLRSDRNAGTLMLNWGDAPGQQCTLHYRLPPRKTARFSGSALRAANPFNLSQERR
ncbi:FimD/PapC C-terminal domain-containing protein [Serratia ureilytica]